MNVFILSTGRCGSTTFIRACEHITNYTAGHETRIGMVGDSRLDYPIDHIEADNRLSWFLGRLGDTYGDAAFYVHLTRDEEATARSFVGRWDLGIIRAYRSGIHVGSPEDVDRMLVARDYCRTVNTNITAFLRGRPNTIAIELERARDGFRMFWERIGAAGDLDAALAEWDTVHNPTRPAPPPRPPRVRVPPPRGPLPARIVSKVRRVVRKLPAFLRSA